RLVLQARAIAGSELRSHRLEVVAGIEAFRYSADVLPERLAVAQERRARERVDLRAGIVDVVFPRDLEGGEGQRSGERVPEHRAGAMADVQRSGRVGRDVFDVDRDVSADVAAPIIRTGCQDRAQCVNPGRGLERQVYETRARHLGLR